MDQTIKNMIEIEVLKALYLKGNIIIQSQDKDLIKKLKDMTVKEINTSSFFNKNEQKLKFAEKTIEKFFNKVIFNNKEKLENYQ